MATIKALHPAYFITNDRTESTINLWDRFLEFADSQKPNRTLWFFIVLMVHGVLILPLPAVLMYYFNAPVWVLSVTMTAFFANIIANMAGGTTRTTLTLFAASILAHLIMLLIFTI
ncbi:MAG: hypothetical protein ABIN95_05990 [Mucilaginibacter sp.]